MIYGLLGWCVEVFWTGMGSLFRGDFTLQARTSIWMFFVYGLALLLEPIHHRIRHWPIWMRGSVYTVIIFAIEYMTGLILSSFHLCPWDYSGTTWSVHGLIRLDYAPAWFLASLLFEKIHDYLTEDEPMIVVPKKRYS